MARNAQHEEAEPTSSRRVLMIAALLGVLAAALNFMYMYDVSRQSLTVYKANRVVKAGEPLDEGSFEKVVLTGDVGKMRSVAVDTDSFAAFAQQPLAESLEPGDILLTRSFLLGGQTGLRDSIGKNQRALSLAVADEAQAVGYFVRPGDMIDVWGVTGTTAFPIAKAACVKAIGDAYLVPQEGGRDGRYRSVTIFVPADDAKVEDLLSNVSLAEDELSLALVGKCREGETAVSPRFAPPLEAEAPHPDQGGGGAPREVRQR
jgi:hypothetical protein